MTLLEGFNMSDVSFARKFGSAVGILTPCPKTVESVNRRVLQPERASSKLVWQHVFAFSVYHALIPLMFVDYFFSWTGVALVFIGNYIFDGWGISMGYHRFHTHKGFKCSKWFERLMATLGLCCLTDHPIRWVTQHRIHHQHSDQSPDPHTPKAGFWWGHCLWLIHNDGVGNELYKKHAADLLNDPYYAWLRTGINWFAVYILHTVMFFVAGFLIGWLQADVAAGVQFGLSLWFWGVVVRTVLVWHVTWAVNSVCHTFGYRNYDTTEGSTNNWLVALFTHGEGWHNNHHGDQRTCRHGHKWWEYDTSYWTLRVLEKFGIVWDLVEPKFIRNKK
jgi:fatty-acid desaturase